MKKFAGLLLIVIFLGVMVGAGFSAINKVPLLAKGVSTVDTIKKLSFPYAPLLVPPDSSDPAAGESAPAPEVSAQYKTGTGVILSTTNLLDDATHSSLAILNAKVNGATMRQMQSATTPYATIQIYPPKNNFATLFAVMFEKMPGELHTYILTVKLESATNLSHLSLRVNNMNFSGDQLMINPSTNEIRVLFTYAALNNRMNVSGLLTGLNYLTSDITLKLHYVQLTQID